MGREITTVPGDAAEEAAPNASARTRLLKLLQLAVSVGVLVLFWLVYPGVLLAFAGVAGLCYLVASVAAMRDRIVGIWLAFAFSLLTMLFSGWGVYRYLDNGFDYLAGNFDGRAGVYWPAYLFLLVAAGSIAVVVLHALSWRWMLRPRQRIAG
ncbi:MAG: hypothetical protein JXB36_06520 [Gammaproteobacteria bacterium]|nr:hypothetical protein [Gammaproteobacteria bacterium]